jgi:lysine-specific demethylase 8
MRIERISMPSREVFYRDYVLPRRPVIITNLFAQEPISEIRTMAAARKAFGDVALEVQTEYSSMAADRGSAASGTLTLSEYLDFAEQHPDSRVMCTEYSTPARVAAQYRLPDLCRLDARGIGASEILDLPRRWGDHDLLSNMFLGNRGNCAHLHYDGDHRQVLLYQVFGRKRVVLFQPPNGTKLNVLDAFMQGFCNTYLERMSDEEKSAFVDYADGYDAMLEPGEAVYMPMLIWHYLEYVDTGMSVNFRFGRNRYGRFLCVDNLHRDYYVQNVGAKMVDEDLVQAKYTSAIEEIKAAFVRPSASRSEKTRDMRALFKRLCTSISPEAEPETHCPPEREAQQLAQIEAELEKGIRYSSEVTPGTAQGSVNGTVSAAQMRVIRGRVQELAYPQGIFEKVLYNRFAKVNLEQLTRTEAALLIRGFASPGARW